MKFATWCVGWLVLCFWLQWVMHTPGIPMWGMAVLFLMWILLGLAMGLITLIKLSLGKLGAGGRGFLKPPTGTPPAPQQKPKEGA